VVLYTVLGPQTRDHCTSLNLSVGSVLEGGLGWGSERLNMSSRSDFYHLVPQYHERMGVKGGVCVYLS
jgi:hypothetical protein